VYANTLQTFWAIAAGEQAGLPTIWNVHESEPWQTYFDFLPPDLKALSYRCFAFPYRIVFVANATRQAWAALESAFNYTVIHNGLDRARLEARLRHVNRNETRERLGVLESEVAIVLIGTVCERKGQLDLIEALAQLAPAAADRVKAFIVGDRPGEYSAKLHQAAQRLPANLSNRVTIVAETTDVASYLKAADIAVCASRIESFPRVILEAMVAGLPIVTTPVFGIREQIREDVNGLFFEPGSVATLASILQRVILDDELRDRLASNSRPVLDSLTSYSEMLHQYGEIFREAKGSLGDYATTTISVAAAE
jgi:O-antigen biosynthesis protein